MAQLNLLPHAFFPKGDDDDDDYQKLTEDQEQEEGHRRI